MLHKDAQDDMKEIDGGRLPCHEWKLMTIFPQERDTILGDQVQNLLCVWLGSY